MSDVASELSVQWGVGPIALRKLVMESFKVRLGEANDACGSIPPTDGHGFSERSHAQLNESWMGDLMTEGTEVALVFDDAGGWSLSVTRGSQSLVTPIGVGSPSSTEAFAEVERFICRVRPDAPTIVWRSATGDARRIVGSFGTEHDGGPS